MKVTLDLSKLLEEGRISQSEFDRLRALAAQDTGSLAFNILIGFGISAISLGAVALVPNPIAAAVVGGALFAFGLALVLGRSAHWGLLAQICLCVGALTLAGGIIAFDSGSLRAMFLVTLLLAAASIAARSGLLMVGAVLAASSCLGASTGYWHATYELSITEPALTIAVFSALALATYHVSKELKSDYERLALMAARTSVFLVNFGFWIGSLWGDRLVLLRALADRLDSAGGPPPVALPPWLFSVGWALALTAAGIWATRVGRRWVVNVAAVFGAIHFYTQWFDKLGPSPLSFFLGGLVLLAIALGLWMLNHRSEAVPA
jgi:iron complex transport system permease protein